MEARLEIVSGSGAQRTFALDHSPVSLGRSRDNDCVLDDRKVSRRHGILRETEGCWSILRLFDTNPIVHNEQPLEPGSPSMLRSGDRIFLGDTVLSFTATDTTESSSLALTQSTVCYEDYDDKREHLTLKFDPDSATPEALLAVLFRLGTCLLTIQQPSQMREFLSIVCDAFDVRRGFIALGKAWRGDLSGASASGGGGPDLEALAFWSRDGEAEAFTVSRTLISQVMGDGLGTLIGEERGRSDSIAAEGVQTALCVPMLEGERAIGLIYVDSDRRSKPFNVDDLRFLQVAAHLAALGIVNQRLRQRVLQENRRLREELLSKEGLIFGSRKMKQLFELVRRVATSESTVLIRGESGVGKEVIARSLHRLSNRSDGPFIAMNCAAIPDQLLESHLFGHRKGAFTGAIQNFPGNFRLADGGTLFLDEIGDMAPALQAKILRVLQERVVTPVGGRESFKVDVRIVAATNKNLEEAVREGEFRQDLYFRLNVVELNIPPLRERKEDILPLAEKFYTRYSGGKASPTAGIARMLRDYSWPGNVRELENAIEAAFAMSAGSSPVAKDFPDRIRKNQGDELVELGTLADIEKAHIQRVLATVGGNVSKTARVLGVSRSTLYEKFKVYDIKP